MGLVAHSILFKRILQLFWPKDQRRQARRRLSRCVAQEELRAALRNGAPLDTVDPFEDKAEIEARFFPHASDMHA